MTQHLHSERVPGCYRCELGEDESRALDPQSAILVELLRRRGHRSTLQLAEATGYSCTCVRNHLAVMETRGWAESARFGPRRCYWLTVKGNEVAGHRTRTA